jgi:hypothetical protein
MRRSAASPTRGFKRTIADPGLDEIETERTREAPRLIPA